MKSKKLIALLSALAMLTTTAPVFASGEDDLPPMEPEVVEVDRPIELDEPIVPDELEEPVLSDELDAADEAALAYAVEEASESAETRLRGQSVNTYDELQSAIAAANDGDTITLAADIDTDQYVRITKPLTLDLNGCTLTSSHSNGTILVWGADDTVLTIVDDSNDKNGKVLNTSKYAVWVYKGNLTLESGTLESSNNYAVNCAAGTEVIIDGGTITGKHGVATKGFLTMNNGTITGSGYGIDTYGGPNSEVTINNGTVKAATDNTSAYLCAIYSVGTLEINGGTVETIAESTSPHAIRSIYNKGTLTMTAGTVRCISESDLDISLAYPKSAHGIFNNTGAVIEISGGTVECTSKTPETVAPDGIFSQGKLIIDDDTIITVPDGIAITGNGNQHGTECIINGGTIIGGELGIYHPQDGYMEINGGTITGGLTGIEIRAGEMVVNGGEITGSADHLEYDENGTGSTTIGAGIAVVQHDTERTISVTVTDGQINGFVPLFEKNVHNNPQEAIDKVTISISGGVFENTNMDDPNRQAVITDDVDHYMTGGIYSSMISYDYIDLEYYRRHLYDNVYEGKYKDYFEVTKPKITVIDKDRIHDAEIELVDLIQNGGIDREPFSTYRVVIAEASDENVQAIAKEKEEQGDKNTKMSVFDVFVEKTNDAGKTTIITNEIFEQEIKITLLNAREPLENIKVYYISDKDKHIAEIKSGVTRDGNTVTFTAPMLSTYAITYNPLKPTADDIAKEIGVVFEPVAEGSHQYYIKLKPLEKNKMLYRYMSSDIAFKIENVDPKGRVIYEIEPAEYMNATLLKESGDSREYHFEMDGVNEPDATCVFGEDIIIGTITFKGYGEFKLRVDTDFVADPAHTVNIANTAEAADNIVAHYAVEKIDGYGKLVVNEIVDGYTAALDENESGTIHDILSPDVAALTVNIAFNNTVVTDNESAYQDMTLTISGGQLSDDIVIKLGNDSVVPTGTSVTFDPEASAYKVVVGDTLWRNVLYSVKLEGAGYRTVYCTVMMTNDKTLNFWNNVKYKAEFIEEGKATSEVTKNFLAGDIVDDKNINIYDLSAVVSYFGSEATIENGFAKYDLNRDGVIDSKDVAYVLVSWDE